MGDKTARPRVHQAINDRWEVLATYSDDDVFQQVSFVNGINTLRGGKHVDYVADQIRDKMVDFMQKAGVAAKTVAAKHKLDVILLKNAVLYSAGVTDITDELMKDLA